MKKSMFAVAALFAAVAPGSARQAEEPLVLKARRVDVRIRENLALVRFEYTVENVTARPREAEVTFSAPEGAALFETTLAKNVSSKDRVSKLVAATTASDAYTSVRKEVRQGDVARQASDPTGAGGFLGGRSGLPSDDPLSYAAGDPALLEILAGSCYRLRFFPVMPRDDQKATFTMAVEATRVDDGYEVRIPLADSTRFERRKGTTDSIRISALGAAEKVTSSSHELRSGAGGSHDADAGSAEQLVIRYGLGVKAKPFQVESDGAQDGVSAKDEWGRALRALRETRGLGQGEPVAVTSENSLLVIDRTELKRLLKPAGK